MPRRLRVLPLLLVCLALARSALAQAPTIAIAIPTAGTAVHASPISVSGTFTGGDDVAITVNGVDAAIIGSAWNASVPVTALGPFTITATATLEGETPATATVEVAPDVPVIHVESPADGFETGDTTVDTSGFIEFVPPLADPNDPNKTLRLTINGQSVDVAADGSFSDRVRIAAGENALQLVATDRANSRSTNTDVSGTRTQVCAVPELPDTDPNASDPSKPQLYRVSRLDDLPLPANFDFSDPNHLLPKFCDVRPALHDPNGFQPPGGRCTLRAAVQLANAHLGADSIEVPNGIVTLTRTGAGDGRGDLDVTSDLAIGGFGRDNSGIDARKLKDRVFDVGPGVSLTVIDLSMRGGSTPKKTAETGGCIRFAGTKLVTNNIALLECKSGAGGGAIDLTLDAEGPESSLTCTIIARGSAKKDGGGIRLDGGSLAVRNSTIALTSSGASGGAIAVESGALELRNATISTNKAKVGGGLAVAGGASATVNNVTFARNKAKQGVSLSLSDPNVVVSNSILGDKPKKLCDAPVDSAGGNLDPGDSCGLSEKTDLENANPRLDKLATNEGVPTHALLPDSPAIDHGVFASCEPLDERDTDRVDGPGGPDPNTLPADTNPADQCDIGSFEFASSPPEPPAP